MADDTAPVDPVAALLQRAPALDRVRAQAWDAFQASASPDDFAARVKDLDLPNAVKADLWDLKQRSAPAAGGPPPGTVPPPTYRTTNEKDAEGNPVVAGIGRSWAWLNTPLAPQIGEAARAIASYLDQPVLGEAELDERLPGHLGTKAAMVRGAFAGGVEGVGNILQSFTSPIGIALSLAGLEGGGAVAENVPGMKGILALPAVQKLQRAVQVGGGAAFAADGARRVVAGDGLQDRLTGVSELAGGALGAAAAARAGYASQAPVPRLNPQEQAAVQFGEERGVPLDASTRTGSRVALAAQKRVANSMGGEATASRMVADQRAALTRVGTELADETHPEVTYPHDAGESVVGAVRGLITTLNNHANAAYGRLRALENDPRYMERSHTAPEGSAYYQKILAKLGAGTVNGEPPNPVELREMRQIEAELDNQPYQQRTWSWRQPGSPLLKGENAVAGGHAEIVGGSSNPPVYEQILKVAPGEAYMSGRDMMLGIRKALATGEWNNAARGAFEVAKQRLASGAVGGDLLPPNIPLLGEEQTIGLPVSLKQAKKLLEPVYDRLMQERELVPAQMMGDKGRALVALHTLMQGPDYAPASVVDAALGDLKSMARTDLPELRSDGQGVFAQAVKVLEPALQEAVGRAGREGLDALQEGRGSTTAKYFAGDALRQLVGNDAARVEPVAVFDKLTRPQDKSIALLKKVRDLAPEHIQEVGRAWLQQQLEKATAEGRFEKTDRLQAEWLKLGPQTKAILFPEPGLVQNLDHFFLLAKRIGENPNPSGTAHTLTALNFASQPPMWVLSKLLYTNGGAKALAGLMSTTAGPTAGQLRTAARTAAALNVVQAARAAGVQGVSVQR